MLQQEITYENLDGEMVTETFYFNLTKLELMEQDMILGGFEEKVKSLTKTSDPKEAYRIFKEILLVCYGVRDGNDFIKTQELRDRFATSPALSELIISFLQDPTKAAIFVREVMPKSLQKNITDEDIKQAMTSADLGDGVTFQEVPPEKLKISAKDLQNMSKEELQAAYIAKVQNP